MDKFLKNFHKPGECLEKFQIQSKPKTSTKRKYNDDYIMMGFIPSQCDTSLPFCLLCSKTLTNESMAPSKMQRHMDSNHPDMKNKPKIYFEQLRLQLHNQSKKMKALCTIPQQAQIASYKIAQLLAKNKKPHSDAETIIVPSLLIAVETMCDSKSVEKIKSIPLSSDTISRRIKDMSKDVDDQMREQFENENCDVLSLLWALQVDDSTDISNKVQVISYLRYIINGKIDSQFFFCCELKEHSTGKDVFELVDYQVKSRGLKWENCVSVCTDGAPSMQGRHKGFVAYVLDCSSKVKIVHCMIHREVLMSKTLPTQLLQTMNQMIKIVNYIKSNSLKTRIFSSLCEAMDSDYKTLLYHTEVRWLSKGKVLNRVISLRNEIISFFASENIDFDFIENDIWWIDVTFLNDLFDKLNALNVSLQGEKENFITITGKLKAFRDKLMLWMKQIDLGNMEVFPGVNSLHNKNTIVEKIKETLKNLSIAFDKYFPSLDILEHEWVVNPFMFKEDASLTLTEKESLIELRNDLVMKSVFTEKELSQFWIYSSSQYRNLSEKAIRALLPFGSSYLCELGFSTLTVIKSKKRERLQILDDEMRVCLSKIEPRLAMICSGKQAHNSH